MGLGGFTTRDLKHCRLTAGMVALYFSWWNLFVRLADPNSDHQQAFAACFRPSAGKHVTPAAPP